MISTGKTYQKVPRDPLGNLRFRRKVLAACEGDNGCQGRASALRSELNALCADDILFWINVFGWQYNPKSTGAASTVTGPFVTWGVHDELVRKILDCIETHTDLVIEKSRDMGASWLCLFVMAWFLIFRPNSTFLAVSRNADAVDSPKSDSLFWKIDYMLAKLPGWMCEVGQKNKTITRRKMSYDHTAINSMIVGEATTKKIGIGGRATAMFMDEFSQIGNAWSVLSSTSDTSGCRIFNGTHTDMSTAFYELCQKGLENKYLEKHLLHWSMHPDKGKGAYWYDRQTQRLKFSDPTFVYPADFQPVTTGDPSGGPYPGLRSPWYDKEVQRKANARGVAADLDINPAGSSEQVFDPQVINDLKARYCRDPLECDLLYDPDTAEPKRLIPAKGGPVKLWCTLSADGLPQEGYYAFGQDIAAGTGATPSCNSGINAETGEKVLEYANPWIEPREFAYLCVALARLFKTKDGTGGKLCWEATGSNGGVFTKHVGHLNYRNVYWRKDDRKLGGAKPTDSPGWNNTPESLKYMVTNYKDALKSLKCLNRSEFALSECLAFVYGPDGNIFHTGWKDAKDPSAGRVNHGDRVVSDGLAWKLVDEWGRLVGAGPTTAATNVNDANNAHPFASLASRKLQAMMDSERDWI